MNPSDQAALLDKVLECFRRIGLGQPYLVGLIDLVEPRLDDRVPSIGIFASGRLLINPGFIAPLSAAELQFVLTHELYHLTLRTHERAEGTDPLTFNFAHDFIINDMLRVELQVSAIPAGGLDWPGARHLSAEKIIGELEQNPYARPAACWGNRAAPGEATQDAASAGDVLDNRQERSLFPEVAGREQRERIRQVRDQIAHAMGMRALMEAMEGKGDEPGEAEDAVAALRSHYRPPWELALQRWFESASPSDRSYARPSRRGAERTDVVLPGRKREGWTLHIVLDTSGSMVGELPRALGAIADFCQATGVEQVHLIQCDTEIGSDEILAPAELHAWRIRGYGGSNLTPAMRRLADNADVHAAIVLTDGDIDYPRESVPYNVLWVLPAWKDPGHFAPGYGKVIAITH